MLDKQSQLLCTHHSREAFEIALAATVHMAQLTGTALENKSSASHESQLLGKLMKPYKLA